MHTLAGSRTEDGGEGGGTAIPPTPPKKFDVIMATCMMTSRTRAGPGQQLANVWGIPNAC